MLPAPIAEADGFFCGEDKDLDFTIYQADGETLQTVFTGWHMRWFLYLDPANAALLSIDATIADAPSGLVRVAVPGADTASLVAREYSHVLWRTDTGQRTVLAAGPCALLGVRQPA